MSASLSNTSVLKNKNLLNLFEKIDNNNFQFCVECDLCKNFFASINLLRKHKCEKKDVEIENTTTRCCSTFSITNKNSIEDERENNCYSLPPLITIPNFHLRCISDFSNIDADNKDNVKNNLITKNKPNLKFEIKQNSKLFLPESNFLKIATIATEKTKEKTLSNTINLIQSQKHLKYFSEQQINLNFKNKDKSLSKNINQKRFLLKNYNDTDYNLKVVNKNNDKFNDEYDTTTNTLMPEIECKRKRSISPLSSNFTNIHSNLSLNNLPNHSSHFIPSLSFDSVAAAALQHQSKFLLKKIKFYLIEVLVLLNNSASTPLLMQQHANTIFGISSTNNESSFFQNNADKQLHQSSSHHLMNTLMLAANGNCNDDDWESMMEVINFFM